MTHSRKRSTSWCGSVHGREISIAAPDPRAKRHSAWRMRGAGGLAALALSGTIAAASLMPDERTGYDASHPGAEQVQPTTSQPSASRLGRLPGCTVRADTGEPIRHAIVTASSQETREIVFVVTGADGCFEFSELPAGHYVLHGSKTGFVTSGIGDKSLGRSTSPVALSDGETAKRVYLRLSPAGNVTGRVVDEFGEPIADVSVRAYRYQVTERGRRLVPAPAARSAMTNDLGEFRLFSLLPGQYYLLATFSAVSTGASAYSGPGLGYIPTYYPNGQNISQAQPISIGIGASVAGVSISLARGRAARIDGVVTDSQGSPISSGSIQAELSGASPPAIVASASIRGDGTFSLLNVPPGDYSVSASYPARASGSVGEWINASLSINGEDMAGVRLVGQRMARIRGQIVTDAIGQAAPRPASIRVAAVALDSASAAPADVVAHGVQKDMTFELVAPPGASVIRLLSIDPGWALKSIRVGATDIVDTGLMLRPADDLRDVQIIITDQLAELTGQLIGPKDVLRNYTILLFPRERGLWHLAPRYFATGRPDGDGMFRLRGLLPGDYIVAAVDDLDPQDSSNPLLLERLSTVGHSISLREGQAQNLILTANGAR